MRILVVDDHELVRRGICSVLTAEPMFALCGEAVDGADAIEKARVLRPDIVVMDISMPYTNGLEATLEIKRFLPEAEIVIVSQHETPEMLRQAFNAGARAYVAKSSISIYLIEAIRKASRHETFVNTTGQENTRPNIDAQEVLQRSAMLEKALRESEDRFRSAMNNIAEGLYTVDIQGLVTYVNPAAEAMFGWISVELLGKKMHDVTHYKHLDGTPFPAAECPGLQVVQQGVELREHEDVFIRKDGSFFPVVFSASPLKSNGTVSGIVVCFRDNTKYRETREALRREVDAIRVLGAIVDSSDDAIISKNLDGTITSWNKGAERIFGYIAEEAVGRHITLIIPSGRQKEEATILEQLKRGERIDHFETIRMTKDGRELDISLTISPVKDDQGRIVGASKIARDITERRRTELVLHENEERLRTLTNQLEMQAHGRTQELQQRNKDVLEQSEQLRELSQVVMRLQDEERRHIARELHDSAGQLLTALGMVLGSLAHQAERSAPRMSKEAEEGQRLVQELSREIRTMSYLLHPPLLDESGLPAALGWYVHGLKERSGLDITLSIPETFGRLSAEAELVVFRIVQESLTNIHRHSGSKHASIRIEHESGSVSLEIQDRGKGIPPEELSKIQQGAGVGIRGMRERVRQLGGEMNIESNGSGTKILVRLPNSSPDTAQSTMKDLQTAG